MIHQYRVCIDHFLDLEVLEVISKKVSFERRNRAAKYRLIEDKVRCLLAEVLVRYALSTSYGIKENVVVKRSTFGKPFLVHHSVHFNISHSGSWVVCAVGDSMLGIDVEEVKAIDYRSIYNSFSTAEIEYLDTIRKSEDRREQFYKLWTAKESFVKYCGTGLSYPFDSFSIDVVDENIALVSCTHPREENVVVYSEKIDENHWYSICTYKNEQLNTSKIVMTDDLRNVCDFK